MASYHDLKKSIYEGIQAKSFTRIHGRPTWRLKERLIDKCKDVALRYDASYDRLGGYGLLSEIIEAARFTAPPNGNPANAQVRQAASEN